MKFEHLSVNFEDDRGSIRDIFAHDPKDSCTVVVSKKGAVRGNHYHKLSTQYTYVVSGQLTMLSQNVGETTIEKHVLRPGDMMTHGPNEAHTLIADEDTVFLAFADGLRGGEEYEKDTFRLEVPLQDQLTAAA
ncbi:MAG: cupin domain-containing protein [Patescibacteria group bacterium]|jgi:quercetin dioxygenase-like cupin family protein